MAGKFIDATLRFIDNFTGPMNQAIRRMEESARTYQKAGKQIQAAGNGIANAGKKLTNTITVPIVGLGVASVKTAAEFETSMDKVQSIAGVSSQEMSLLTEKAKEMGAKTKFSASEAADAFSYMAMAGWKTTDMMNGIEGIMYLAGATGEDLAQTSDIVTDALTAFGMTAADTNRFVDVLAKASSNANTNVSLMGETFKYVAPSAGALGYSVEDTAVAIGLMANSGIKASQAGTSLNSLLTRMAKPTKESQKAMSALGISLTDSQGNMKSFASVMSDMRKGFAGLTETQKAQYAAMLAGKTGMAGLLGIVNASESDFEKLTKAIADSNGAAKEMYDIANDNLTGQLTIIKSTIESIAITFGEKMLPYVKKGAEKLQELADRVNNLNDAQVANIIKWAGIAAAVGPAILVFGKVVIGIGKVVSAIGKMGAAIKAAGGVIALFTSPAAIVIGVLAGIAAAAVLIYKNWDKVKSFLIDFGNNVKKVFNESGHTIEALKGKFEKITGKFPELVEKAKELWRVAGPYVIEFGKIVYDMLQTQIGTVLGVAIGLFNSLADTVLNVADKMVDCLGGLLDFFTGVFSGDWEKACEGLKTTFKANFEIMEALAKAPLDAIVGMFKGAASQLKKIKFVTPGLSFDKYTDYFQKFKIKASDAFVNVKKQIKEFGKNIKSVFDESGLKISGIIDRLGGIKEKFNHIKTGTKEFYDVAKEYLDKFKSETSETFENKFAKVAENAKKKWQEIKIGAAELWEEASPYINKFGEAVKFVFDVCIAGAAGGVVGAFNAITNTVLNFVDGIMLSFGGLVDFLAGSFTGDTERALQGFKDMWGGHFQALVELVKAPVNAIIGVINGAVAQINKLGIKIPEWVPKYGGESFSVKLPTLSYLYKGTNNWSGGPAMIHDRGAEIVDLPKGTRVYPHDKSIQMARAEGSKSVVVNIPKLADSIIIREDADIDRLMDAFARKLDEVAPNMA